MHVVIPAPLASKACKRDQAGNCVVAVVRIDEGTAVLVVRKAGALGVAAGGQPCARLRASVDMRAVGTEGCPDGVERRMWCQTGTKGWPVLAMALRATSSLRATAMMPTLAWPERPTTLR